jgi:DNA-binding beta-propeller fold protein YncE
MTDVGGSLWIPLGTRVLICSAKTGHVQSVLDGRSYGFNGANFMASNGTDVWISNHDGDSVTEINTESLKLVRVLQGQAYDFRYPEGVAVYDNKVWVANVPTDGTGTVTEFPASALGLTGVQRRMRLEA